MTAHRPRARCQGRRKDAALEISEQGAGMPATVPQSQTQSTAHACRRYHRLTRSGESRVARSAKPNGENTMTEGRDRKRATPSDNQ